LITSFPERIPENAARHIVPSIQEIRGLGIEEIDASVPMLPVGLGNFDPEFIPNALPQMIAFARNTKTPDCESAEPGKPRVISGKSNRTVLPAEDVRCFRTDRDDIAIEIAAGKTRLVPHAENTVKICLQENAGLMIVETSFHARPYMRAGAKLGHSAPRERCSAAE